MEQYLTPPSYKPINTTLSPPPLKRQNIDFNLRNDFQQRVTVRQKYSHKIRCNHLTSQYEQHQQNNSYPAETGRSTPNELDILFPISIKHISSKQDEFDIVYHEQNLTSRPKVFLLSPRFSFQKDRHSIFNEEKKFVDRSSANTPSLIPRLNSKLLVRFKRN